MNRVSFAEEFGVADHRDVGAIEDGDELPLGAWWNGGFEDDPPAGREVSTQMWQPTPDGCEVGGTIDTGWRWQAE
ncbi:hypothetical protein GCM10009675_40260 [Prauserella alba]|uniref:Uncharacterized protein n=1 Tax=Prauserella alba TaxID=176898 RepID=A0ABN1VMY3_9PSEU